ncbi:MAG: thioredoxin domain-containing protein [Halobacteriovoraceae bacterium]|nr:thioredoxin domain-containing protein [Halobacteriovoraceae bacterium]MCB9093893.1 thioredoxin domain-containing protein [Halobacteriovoraceae bacterium]
MKKTRDYNRLKDSSSLYLKQHSHQKIHWWSWCDEAIEEAKKRKMPIFISIGYSSCHWCHVMSRETFDDPQVADFLNENFVSIKVDREENPDVDTYFQQIALKNLGRGGWPLNFFTNSDLIPIAGGTYFPPKDFDNMPSFLTMAKDSVDKFQNHLDEIEKHGHQLIKEISKNPSISANKEIKFEGHFVSPSSILNALKPYEDAENGGYGDPPRFPSFAYYEWAIEQILEGVVPKEFAEHIIKTIEAICCGGIFDQIRGGIHRYSTDKKWLVPHFEKMLYDQSGLLRLLVKTTLLYPSPIFFDAIILTLEYLEAELLSEDGYFFSAQDAESEGVEGLYFTFTEEEFEEALNQYDDKLADQFDNLKKWFGVTPLGNFENNLNVISINRSHLKDILDPLNWEIIRNTKQALYQARKQRVPPATDTKGVASWNFMLISSLCDLIQYSKIEIVKKQAQGLLNACLEGIHNTFIKKSEDGKTIINHSTTTENNIDHFEDYVFFAEAHTRLYEVSGKEQFKKNALLTLEHIVQNYFDGKFFRTRPYSKDKNLAYPNLHYALYDQSYRSPSCTLIHLLRKWKLYQPELTRFDGFEELINSIKQFSLGNPIAFGEALRSVVYPPEVYKKIEVPKSWLKSKEFIKYRTFFSVRFLMIYSSEESGWQICDTQSCEGHGETVEEFIDFLSPKNEKA